VAATSILHELKSLTTKQRSAVIAAFLGWTLDAFDFFIVVFVLSNIAHDFNTTVKNVAYGITLTLMMRPVGALIFGLIADRYGRKPTLMMVIVLYSAFELACAFAPNLAVFLILRGCFGVAMGGEWGIGSSLAMESIPPRTRGIVSGFLQEGYAFGYLLAAVLYWVAYDSIGWKGIFMARRVEESPVWQVQSHSFGDIFRSIGRNWKIFLYIVVLMACFNAFSHGTQDIYPTFLKSQHNFGTAEVSILAIIANLGAITGGILFGAFSQNIGRRRAIIVAAVLSLPIIPLWAYSQSFLGLAVGAFMMQLMVQGAWGVIPVHLNEMSPEEVRGTFPGFTYQLGNFLISLAAPIQIGIAASRGGDYSFALSTTAGVVAVAVVVVVGLGQERRGIAFGHKGEIV
jgi:SHS family lactate transporter-like MFS transporter